MITLIDKTNYPPLKTNFYSAILLLNAREHYFDTACEPVNPATKLQKLYLMYNIICSYMEWGNLQ